MIIRDWHAYFSCIKINLFKFQISQYWDGTKVPKKLLTSSWGLSAHILHVLYAYIGQSLYLLLKEYANSEEEIILVTYIYNGTQA